MDRMHLKKLLTICLALMLSVSMLPAGTFAAAAEGSQDTAVSGQTDESTDASETEDSAQPEEDSASIEVQPEEITQEAPNAEQTELPAETGEPTGIVSEQPSETSTAEPSTEAEMVEPEKDAAPEEEKDALDLSDFLTTETGVYYLPEEKDTWEPASNETKLDPESRVLLHIAYEIPSGKVAADNAEAEYTLPAGISMTDEEVKAANDNNAIYEGKDREAEDLKQAGEFEIREDKILMAFASEEISDNEAMTGFLEIEVNASDLLGLGKYGEDAYKIEWNDDDSIDTVVTFAAEKAAAASEESESSDQKKDSAEEAQPDDTEKTEEQAVDTPLHLMAGMQNVLLAAANAAGRDGEGEHEGVKYSWAIDWATTADGTNFTYDEDVLSIHPANWNAKVKVYARLTMDVNAVKDGAEIPAGMVKFTVPTHLFYGWNGEAADDFIAPEDLTSDPATSKGNFYYTIDGDTVTITNHKPLGGTDYFSTQIGWSVDPLDINGGYPDKNKPHDNWWDNYINPYETQMEGHFIFGDDVKDKNIDLRMATQAETKDSVSYLKNGSSTNHDYDRYLSWQDNWGEKPADADDYFYIFWEVGKTRQATTTQPFEFTVSFDRDKNAFTIGDKTFRPDLVGIKKINDGAVGNNFLYGHNRTRLNGASEGAPTVNQISGKNYDTGRLASSSYTHLPYGDDDGDDYIPSGLDYGSKTGYISQSSGVSGDSGIRDIGSTDYLDTGTAFVVLLRYPWGALKAAEEAGRDLANDGLPVKATFHMQERWDSGYKIDKDLEAAPTNIYLIKEAVGTIDKSKAVYADTAGGQSGVLNDLVVGTNGWSMGYTGSSKTSGSQCLGQTIIIEDDNKMSLFPEGSSAQAESLTEDDYEFAGYRLQTLDEYEGDYSHDIWSARQNRVTDWTKYGHVYIYTRSRGETEYKPYEELEITGASAYTRYSFTLDGDGNPVTSDKKGTGTYGSSYSTIALPADTTGVRAVYHSDYYKTAIRVGLTARLLPTDHVKSIAQKHFDANKPTRWNNTADFYIGPEKEPGHYGTASSHLQLTRISPTLGLIKSAYTLPDDDARQKEAGKDKQQLAYVVLRATMSVSGAAELTAPYKMYKGTFYELLPKGVAVKDGSLRLVYDGTGWANPTTGKTFAADEKLRGTAIPEEYYSYRTETDPATGQTMLIIDYSIPEDKMNLAASGHMQAGFVLVNTIDNINAHGTLTANTVGFTLNTNASGVILKKGDSYEEQTDSFGERAASFKDIADNNTYPVFTQTNIEWNNPKTIEAGFTKDVIANNTKNGLPADANFKKEDEVLVGNTYTYQLKFSTQPGSTAKNIIFYDVLETGTDDDSKQSDWTGFLNSIDLSALEAKETDGGTATCAPVVYYSTTVKDRNSLNGGYFDLTDGSRWSTTAPSDLKKVTAIAIDCTKDSNGNDFVLGEEQMVRALVTMDTPAPYTPEINEFALNGAVVKLTAGKSNGSSSSTETDNTALISDAKVKLRPVALELHKVSDPVTGTENEPTKVKADGDGTIDYTLTVRNSGSYDYRNVVVEDEIPAGLTIKENEIMIGLNGAEPKLVSEVSGATAEIDGQKVSVTIAQQHPTVLDDEGEVTTDKDTRIIIKTTVDELTKTGVKKYVNQGEITSFNDTTPEDPIKSEITYHEAEMISIPVEKVWKDGEDKDGIRPDSVNVKLFTGEGADKTDTNQTITLNERNKWKGEFSPLPKYEFVENDEGVTVPAEIVYSVEETKDNTVTGTDGWAAYADAVTGSTSAGYKVTNTHTPFKTEVKVTKTFRGLDAESLPSDFKITASYKEFDVASGAQGKTASKELTLKDKDVVKSEDELTYTWTIKNVCAGTKFEAVETGYEVPSYRTERKVAVSETAAAGEDTVIPEGTDAGGAIASVPNTGAAHIDFTNKYTYSDLWIYKTLPEYVLHDGSNEENVYASFAFHIEGYSDKECTKKVYDTVKGIEFDSKSASEGKAFIGKVPVDVVAIRVTEISMSDYKADGDNPVNATMTEDADGNWIFKAEFTNSKTGNTYESGVVNKYKRENGEYSKGEAAMPEEPSEQVIPSGDEPR